MRLSIKMVNTILACGAFSNNDKFVTDGRTVRALQRRGLAKAVKWERSRKQWRFRLTANGQRIGRQLTFIDSNVREMIF